MIVLGMTEGGFLLLEFLTAFAVNVSWQSSGVVRRCSIRHLLHSTTKLHSAAQQITAVAEIHADKISQETFSA